jgi:chromosome segregation ATPase
MRGAGIAVLALAACVPPSGDPAEGGLVNGLTGLAGGGYESRVAEREQAVAAAQSRQEALATELATLEREHANLKGQIVQQREALRTQGVRLSPQTEDTIQAVLADAPTQADPAGRAAALQRAIADARRLSEQLAALAG